MSFDFLKRGQKVLQKSENQHAATPSTTPLQISNNTNTMPAIVDTIEKYSPILDHLGLDIEWRKRFMMKAGLQMVKGKFDWASLLNMPEERKKTGFQKFWIGMKEGLPVIIFIYGLIILTLILVHRGVV